MKTLGKKLVEVDDVEAELLLNKVANKIAVIRVKTLAQKLNGV